jgi:aminoglycoside phosphotransferase (APT) family kinase protein
LQNDKVLDLGAFARVTRAAGGFDTTVWHLERDRRHYALRVFRPEQMATLQRELVALGAARRGGVPVPRIHAIGTSQERPALLMDWCPGRPLRDELRARPHQLLALGARFGQQQRSIHRVAVPASLRANWIGWAGPLEPSFAAHLARLSLGRPPRLLHLDYHPLNVLFQAGQVSAVLDWTNAHAGDPRADFARTVTILRLSPPRARGFQRLGRALLELGWRYGYGPVGTSTDLAPFYAWAGAAMEHDLAGRFSPSELAHVRRWTHRWSVVSGQ